MVRKLGLDLRSALLVMHVLLMLLHLSQFLAFVFEDPKFISFFEKLCLSSLGNEPKGAYDIDSEVWPHGPCMRPGQSIVFFFVLLLYGVVALAVFLRGHAGAAFLVMIFDISGGMVDHLAYFGGTLPERLGTTPPAWLYLALACAAYLRRPAKASHMPQSVLAATSAVAAGVLARLALLHLLGITPNMRARAPPPASA